MQKSKNYNLKLPEPEDYIIVGDFNFNFETLDSLIKELKDFLSVEGGDGDNLLALLKKKADLENGKVKKEQLPNLDEYLDLSWHTNKSGFPSRGDSKKIYIDKEKNTIYKWSGSAYVELSKSLSIGETKGTAFDGARGKALEDEMQKRYTKDEVDKMIAKLKEEISGDIITQILAYS